MSNFTIDSHYKWILKICGEKIQILVILDYLYAWKNTKLSSRKCYLSLKAPGTFIKKSEEGIPIKFLGKEPNKKESEKGYKNFAVISNHILSIEWLCLSSQGHKRIKYNWNNRKLSYQWLIP